MKPRITILAMLSALSLATVASAQVKTRDHRKQPPPPPPSAPTPAPQPPPPPAAPAWNNAGWTLLGELAVNGKRDNDVLKIGKYQGRFDQLTMVVTDSDLELTKFVVHFDKGKKFAPKLRHFFAENSRTAVIDLPGNDRIIKKIALGYKNLPRGGKAFVQIWGRDTGPAAPAEPVYTPPKWESTGWESLGSLEVKGKNDRDTLKLGRDDGHFDKLTFVVHDNDLEMFDVVVTFLNGETFSPTTRLVFKEGSRTGAIDLPGDDRYIKQIDFHYGNLGRRGKGRAKVEVFGKPSKKVYTPPKWEAKGWESLGSLEVKGKHDHDTLKVGRDDGRFDKLTFVVHDNDLEMFDVVVHFLNGEKFSPTTRLVFKEGSRTGSIDLPGEQRYIKQIDFHYGNLGRRGTGRARVEVFGKPSKYVYTPPVFDATGWESLGKLEVKGKKDRDVLKVGRDDGRFTKLTVVVSESDLEMFDIVIKFGNGEKFSPSTRLVFKEGSRTGVIDLPGEKRFIKKIEFVYGNLPGGGRAKVEVFGLPAPAEVKVRDHRDDKPADGGKGGVKVRDHRKQK